MSVDKPNTNNVVLPGSTFLPCLSATETIKVATNRCFPPGKIHQNKELLYEHIVSFARTWCIYPKRKHCTQCYNKHGKLHVRMGNQPNINKLEYNIMKCGCLWRVCCVQFGDNPLHCEIRITNISNQHTNSCTPCSDQ